MSAAAARAAVGVGPAAAARTASSRCGGVAYFHDLRHTHKTWLIEDEVPEAAQAKRLGHRLPGIRGIYSHVSATVEQRLVDGLQRRWSTAPQNGPPTGDDL